jgi:adenylyl-sulfate kinase
MAPELPSRRPRGLVVWLTGLSGAGKSTLAAALCPVLTAQYPAEVLDGDEIRAELSNELSFSKEDRDRNVRRIGYVARLLGRNGVAVVAAAISPYAEVRNEVRARMEREGVPFIEVHVHADLPTLIERDTKGLYKKALAGEIKNLTGISDPYQPPTNPEVMVRTDRETVGDGVKRIVRCLQERGVLTGDPHAALPGGRGGEGSAFEPVLGRRDDSRPAAPPRPLGGENNDREL